MQTLAELLEWRVQQTPHAPFLLHQHQQWSFQQVHTQARHHAAWLLSQQEHPQGAVFIWDHQNPQTVMWILGAALAGVTFAVIPCNTSQTRLQQMVENACPIAIIDPNKGEPGQSTATKLPRPIGTDPLSLVFTSGSTGTPKAIICPNQTVVFAAASIHSYLKNTPHDRIGLVLPLSFDYGLYQVYLALLAGCGLVMLEGFSSANQLIQHINHHGITGLPGMRSVFVGMSRLPSVQVPTLRYFTNTGDSVPEPILQRLFERFPDTAFVSMYGLSECKRALYLPPEKVHQKPGSVGQPIPGTRARLVNSQMQPVPTGEVGELVVEGPHVMAGYLNDPQETAKRFFRGPQGQPCLRTGDHFYQDQDGDFYFVARNSDWIKSAGYRINPREVERLVLQLCPQVQECMVYATDHEVLGQALVAEVIPTSLQVTLIELHQHLRKHLEPHLVPARILLVEGFTFTSSGKYQRSRPGRLQDVQ